MSNEMIERVARAICGAPFPSSASMRKARAAIAAMAPEIERMLGALADIGGADDMDEASRRAKANRIYYEMRSVFDDE